MKIVRAERPVGVSRDETVAGRVYQVSGEVELLLRVADPIDTKYCKHDPTSRLKYRFVGLVSGNMRRPPSNVRYVPINAAVHVEED